MEEIILFLVIIFLFLVVLLLFSAFLFTFLEDKFGLIFYKPFFVHFYPVRKTLTEQQRFLLRNQVPYYQSLEPNFKSYFEHRIFCFIAKYKFIGMDGFAITDEVKIKIAATYIMLTFGMRNYLFDVFNKIIVYPSIYFSTINQQYHKGEFNPRAKAIVFSWDDFCSGHDIQKDNINLGIHEFAHALHAHGLKNDDSSAMIFARMYKQITNEVNFFKNKEKLIQSNYFRIYGYTNQFEFLAVLLEHYFETPLAFKAEFPKLYDNVSKMLNHKH